jgi:hypothetical protein
MARARPVPRVSSLQLQLQLGWFGCCAWENAGALRLSGCARPARCLGPRPHCPPVSLAQARHTSKQQQLVSDGRLAHASPRVPRAQPGYAYGSAWLVDLFPPRTPPHYFYRPACGGATKSPVRCMLACRHRSMSHRRRRGFSSRLSGRGCPC